MMRAWTAFGFGFLFLNACSGTDGSGGLLVEVNDENRIGMTWEEFRRQAAGPEINGKIVYTLDGDVFTDSEEGLREYYDWLNATEYDPKLAVFRRISTGFEPTYNATAALNIRYCVSNDFNFFIPFNQPEIVAAMQAATLAWQNVANVRFVHLPAHDAACSDTTAAVDFAVIPSTHPDYSGCAANKMMWIAGCPVTGPFTSSGTRGVLAVNLPNLDPFVSTQGLLMHELGHMLGFRHEHPWGPANCGGGEPQSDPSPTVDIGFRRLTNYDQPSVMHYQGVCGKPNVDYTLSRFDGEGSRTIYGMPASWYVPVL
jgi:hypothetical protein